MSTPTIGLVVPASDKAPRTREDFVALAQSLPPLEDTRLATSSDTVQVPVALLTEIYQYLRLSLPTHRAQGGHEHRKKMQKKVKEILGL